MEGVAAGEGEGEVGEPGAADEEGGLARHGVQAEHGPEQPGLHGAGVRVPREARGGAEVVVGLGEAADVEDGEVLAADEAEEVGGREGGLVARVEDHAVKGARGVRAGREHHLEPGREGGLAAAVGDEGVDVVVGVERVLPGESLVVFGGGGVVISIVACFCFIPCSFLLCFLSDKRILREGGGSNRRALTVIAPVATAARQGVLRDGEPARRPRHEEAREPQRLDRRVPVVPPVAAAAEIRRRVGEALAARDRVDGKIVDGVLDGAAHGAAKGGRDVAVGEPVGEGAAALGGGARGIAGVVVVGRHDLGVGEHGGEAVGPVDAAADALDVGVGEDVVAVGAALRRAVPEGGARVRQEPDVPPHVDEGAYVLLVGVGLDDLEEGGAAAELEPGSAGGNEPVSF